MNYVLFLLCFCYCVAQRMERIQSYQPCSYDSDCRENSFCIGNDNQQRGVCTCKDAYIMSRNRSYYECLKPAESVGSPCTRDLQCTYTLSSESLCQNGQCQCNKNAHHVSDNNQCYSTSRPGEICTVNFNCLLSDNAIGTCYIGRCRCPLNQHHTGDGICVHSARLGENCNSHDSCRHTAAACYDVCRCIGGYAASDNGWECLKAANSFGESCDQLSQCSEYLEGSICQNNTCTCHPGFHGYGTRCWREVALRGPCNDRRECYISRELVDNVDCLGGVCTCLNGEALDDQCVSTATGSAGSVYVVTFLTLTFVPSIVYFIHLFLVV